MIISADTFAFLKSEVNVLLIYISTTLLNKSQGFPQKDHQIKPKFLRRKRK